MGRINFHTGVGASAPTYTTIVNKTNQQIDPATEDTLNTMESLDKEIRDQLSLPNEDISAPTPAADTDFIVTVDAARANAIVMALYSDVAPSSVTIEGSIDSTNFYAMDGIDVDVSSWSTSKFNVYKIDPYTRYVRVVLHTGSTAPTKIMMIIRGVRA